MTINVDNEELVAFQQAPAHFPGRSPCLQTLHRWRQRGVRGVILETVLIGGIRYTSLEAIKRFVEAANADNPSHQPTASERKQYHEKNGRAAMAALAGAR